MLMTDVARTAREQLAGLTGHRDVSVIGVSNGEGEWVVTVEVCERKGIPDTMDLLGEYEVHLTEEGQLVNFTRMRMRKRGDAR